METFQFQIIDARAAYENGALKVKLHYPNNPVPRDKRQDESLDFGRKVLEKLIESGESDIADMAHPTGSPSAGSLYVFSDGVFACHRRDRFAPTHKLYHSASAGFQDRMEDVYSEGGIMGISLRETAEETLLFTREKIPRLIVPKDSVNYTLNSARRLGIDPDRIKLLYVDAEIQESRDELQVLRESGEEIFCIKGNIDLVFESATSVNILQLRRLPFSSDEVFPVDAEGMMKDGKFMHFNREAYLINPDEIANRMFDYALTNPKVSQVNIVDGVPRVFTPEYEPPFLGPDKVGVISPHIWAPEDLLTTCLDALGVPGFAGKKLEIELAKVKARQEGKNLLSNGVLA